MIEIKQVKTQDEVNYTFVEKLMHTAFPQEERRDTVQQREYSDNNLRFCNNIILENGNSIGMISYWTMGDFYYIEHFAIDPSLRNGGYGKRVLEMIKKQLKGPIVLEVEEPNDEMSTRRIHFYKRLEFTLHKKPYINRLLIRFQCLNSRFISIHISNNTCIPRCPTGYGRISTGILDTDRAIHIGI